MFYFHGSFKSYPLPPVDQIQSPLQCSFCPVCTVAGVDMQGKWIYWEELWMPTVLELGHYRAGVVCILGEWISFPHPQFGGQDFLLYLEICHRAWFSLEHHYNHKMKELISVKHFGQIKNIYKRHAVLFCGRTMPGCRNEFWRDKNSCMKQENVML